MKIAPNYSSEDWNKLDLQDHNSEDWPIAIAIFKERINARYIEPMDILIKTEETARPTDRKYGFVILAIDLLLMETIQAFREGLADTRNQSKDVFIRFLKESPNFSKYFLNDESRERFYHEFRCGILHQAEVQGNTLVWSIGQLHEQADEISIINRTEVHAKLKMDIRQYINDLKNPDNQILRDNFKIKMHAIANRKH